MSFDKYKRGRHHLKGGHQRITYKHNAKLDIANKLNIYPAASGKQLMVRGRPCRYKSLAEISHNKQ